MGDKKNSTIPKKLDLKSEIVEYLMDHGIASEDVIVLALQFHIIDVLDALVGLEKEGRVRRVDEVLLPGN